MPQRRGQRQPGADRPDTRLAEEARSALSKAGQVLSSVFGPAVEEFVHEFRKAANALKRLGRLDIAATVIGFGIQIKSLLNIAKRIGPQSSIGQFIDFIVKVFPTLYESIFKNLRLENEKVVRRPFINLFDILFTYLSTDLFSIFSGISEFFRENFKRILDAPSQSELKNTLIDTVGIFSKISEGFISLVKGFQSKESFDKLIGSFNLRNLLKSSISGENIASVLSGALKELVKNLKEQLSEYITQRGVSVSLSKLFPGQEINITDKDLEKVKQALEQLLDNVFENIEYLFIGKKFSFIGFILNYRRIIAEAEKAIGSLINSFSNLDFETKTSLSIILKNKLQSFYEFLSAFARFLLSGKFSYASSLFKLFLLSSKELEPATKAIQTVLEQANIKPSIAANLFNKISTIFTNVLSLVKQIPKTIKAGIVAAPLAVHYAKAYQTLVPGIEQRAQFSSLVAGSLALFQRSVRLLQIEIAQRTGMASALATTTMRQLLENSKETIILLAKIVMYFSVLIGQILRPIVWLIDQIAGAINWISEAVGSIASYFGYERPENKPAAETFFEALNEMQKKGGVIPIPPEWNRPPGAF